MRLSNDFFSSIWYIIPGFIFLFPFMGEHLFLYPAGFIIISWVIGFFFHQIYRFFYETIVLHINPVLREYKSEMERRGYPKVKGKYSSFSADCYYEFEYWYNRNHKLDGMKRLGNFEASIGTVWFSLLFLLGYFFVCCFNHIFFLTYGVFFILILFLWFSILLRKWSKEKEFYKYKNWEGL